MNILEQVMLTPHESVMAGLPYLERLNKMANVVGGQDAWEKLKNEEENALHLAQIRKVVKWLRDEPMGLANYNDAVILRLNRLAAALKEVEGK